MPDNIVFVMPEGDLDESGKVGTTCLIVPSAPCSLFNRAFAARLISQRSRCCATSSSGSGPGTMCCKSPTFWFPSSLRLRLALISANNASDGDCAGDFCNNEVGD